MIDHERDSYTCPRKGYAPVTSKRCLGIYDPEACGACSVFGEVVGYRAHARELEREQSEQLIDIAAEKRLRMINGKRPKPVKERSMSGFITYIDGVIVYLPDFEGVRRNTDKGTVIRCKDPALKAGQNLIVHELRAGRISGIFHGQVKEDGHVDCGR